MTVTTRATSQRWLDLAEEHRAAVARAVVELVAEGAVPLRVAAIAERAGISRPTFYKHFPTLGAAMLHTVRSLLDELESFIGAEEARAPTPPNGRERLLGRFAASFAFARARPEVTRLFSYDDFLFRATGFESDELSERHEISRRAGQPFLAHFRAGRDDGSIDPGLPFEETYYSLVTSMTGTSQRLLVETDWTTGGDERARAVHDTLLGVWRRALTPQTSGEE